MIHPYVFINVALYETKKPLFQISLHKQMHMNKLFTSCFRQSCEENGQRSDGLPGIL